MIFRTEVVSSSNINYAPNDYLRIFSQVYSASGYSGNNVVEVNSSFDFITYFPDFNENEDLMFLKDAVDKGYSLYVQNVHRPVNTPSLCLYTDPRVTTSAQRPVYTFSVNAVENIAVKVDLTGWKHGSWFLLYQNEKFSGFLVWCGDKITEKAPIDTKLFLGEVVVPDNLSMEKTIEYIQNGLGLNSVFMTEKIDDHSIAIGSPNSFLNINQFHGIKSVEYYPWMQDKILAASFSKKKIIEFYSKVKSDFQDSYVEINRYEDIYSVLISRVSGGIVTVQESHQGNKDEIVESLKGSTLVDVELFGDFTQVPTGKFPLYCIHKEDFAYEKNMRKFKEDIENLNSNVLPDYVYDYGIKHLDYYSLLQKTFPKSILLAQLIGSPGNMCLYYTPQNVLYQGKWVSSLLFILMSIINNRPGEVAVDAVSDLPNGKNENYIKKADSYFFIDPPFYMNKIKIYPLPYNFITFCIRNIVRNQIVSIADVEYLIDQSNSTHQSISGRTDTAKLDQVEFSDINTLEVTLSFNIEEYVEPEIINLKLEV